LTYLGYLEKHLTVPFQAKHRQEEEWDTRITKVEVIGLLGPDDGAAPTKIAEDLRTV